MRISVKTTNRLHHATIFAHTSGIPNSREYPKWFFLHWAQKHLADFQRIAEDKAVTMGHIKRSHLSEAMCVVPDNKALHEGTHKIALLIEEMISLETQSRTLAALRDTLLPKLLSGETGGDLAFNIHSHPAKSDP